MSQTTGIVLSTGILFFTFVVDNYIPPDPLEKRKGSFSAVGSCLACRDRSANGAGRIRRTTSVASLLLSHHVWLPPWKEKVTRLLHTQLLDYIKISQIFICIYYIHLLWQFIEPAVLFVGDQKPSPSPGGCQFCYWSHGKTRRWFLRSWHI